MGDGYLVKHLIEFIEALWSPLRFFVVSQPPLRRFIHSLFVREVELSSTPPPKKKNIETFLRELTRKILKGLGERVPQEVGVGGRSGVVDAPEAEVDGDSQEHHHRQTHQDFVSPASSHFLPSSSSFSFSLSFLLWRRWFCRLL